MFTFHRTYIFVYIEGTNKDVPDEAEYWYYEEIDHRWGDCVFMYVEQEDLSMSDCGTKLPYICEIQ